MTLVAIGDILEKVNGYDIIDETMDKSPLFGMALMAAVYGPMIFDKGKDRIWLHRIKKEEEALAKASREAGIERSFRGYLYGGYNVDVVSNYVNMGFSVEDVVFGTGTLGHPYRARQVLLIP